MGNHMNLEDRRTIYRGIGKKESFEAIGKSIGKSATTVSREIRKHTNIDRNGAPYKRFNDCKHRNDCKLKHQCVNVICERIRCLNCASGCNSNCPHYEQEICNRLKNPPYVCNGCDKQTYCTLEKKHYSPELAQNKYKFDLSECRSGIAAGPAEVEYLNNFISPLVKKGHSIYNIVANHKDEILYSKSTIYSYVHAGVLKDVGVFDLPRAIRYKQRKTTKHDKLKVDRKCRLNRTYEDYLKFMDKNPGLPVVEIDSVEGPKNGDTAVLLTIHFVSCSTQMAFKREANTSASVTAIFNHLYDILGDSDFKKLFPVILADNGTEFSNPEAIEFDKDGNRRTWVFYCEPNRSDQKGACENNHTQIRRIIPKGTSMKNYTQEQINLMMDNINSYKRKHIGDKSPYEVFEFIYGSEIFKKLGFKMIQSENIILKPELLT